VRVVEKNELFRRPSLSVHVVEHGTSVRKDWMRCQLGRNIEFSTERLESYCVATWEPVLYDALVVAAAVEFADRTLKRRQLSWQREFQLAIPVHDTSHWSSKTVSESLHEVLNFLTGDAWAIEFYKRTKQASTPSQGRFQLSPDVAAVIPFSDGLDSRCVSGLLGREMGDRLIRVRLGKKASDGKALQRMSQPFTSVPYHVRASEKQFVESTARSRGFKFALISGLAAYLTKAGKVIVSESGQGALGPALVTVGQGYEDYRSHPQFTNRMEKFLDVLLHHKVGFSFTQLWLTKAETLKKFVTECNGDASWVNTWSCWQQNRHVSVDGKKRQCGICAACLLRRLSVHGAGLSEERETYVWENLSASKFEAGAARSFARRKITGALREYAIAGALHLDHLAQLRTSAASAGPLSLCAFQLGQSLGLPEAEVRAKLDRLLAQHEKEWKGFMESLGQSSFLGSWAKGVQS
jgi:7-cyano-7-deazaguanine synthase in queuosine biosynthesis